MSARAVMSCGLFAFVATATLTAQSATRPPSVPAQAALAVGARAIDREMPLASNANGAPGTTFATDPTDVEDDATITRRRRFAKVGALAGAAAGVLVATRHDDDLGEAAFAAPFMWSGYAAVGAIFGTAVGVGVSFIVLPLHRSSASTRPTTLTFEMSASLNGVRNEARHPERLLRASAAPRESRSSPAERCPAPSQFLGAPCACC